MGLFKEIATPLIVKGVPVFPLRPRTKIAFLTNWQEIATTDQTKVDQWDRDYPDANGACVAFARPDGTWFLEIDKPGFSNVIESQTGQKIPETFMVRSSPGRGHYYFRQTPASIAMGNAQGKDEQGKEAWSARVDNRYVVSPLSYHPTSGRRYETLRDVPILPAPDWLVQWCAKNGAEDRKKVNASPDGPPIPRGSHDIELFRIACLLRNAGMDYEQIKNNLYEVCEKRCVNYGSDWRDMCENKAKSACRYPVGQAQFSAYVAGSNIVGAGTQVQAGIVPVEIEIPKIDTPVYPRFPLWAMTGCSMYDGYIKEVCEKNNRYPEMMFVPGMAIMLNYLGTKVYMTNSGGINGAMVNIIGRKGRVMKSSSVRDMFTYYQYVGILDDYSPAIKNAEGKSMSWTAGSTEGVGVTAQRINCKNMIIYFDELKTLADKAGIEGSSMGGHLLTMLQGDKFANAIKSQRDRFEFAAGQYAASVITCCTDRMFTRYWSKLIAFSDGLEDRATLVYQPEKFREIISPRIYVPVTGEQLTREKQLISNAVLQKSFPLNDYGELQSFGTKYGIRPAGRAQEWALAFAVQMGKTTIDEGCIERGIALEKYNVQVKKYLNVREAETHEAAIQNHIVQILLQNQGKIALRDLHKRIHPDRFGTTVWFKVYNGLIRNGWIQETGAGTKGDPITLILMKTPDGDEDDE